MYSKTMFERVLVNGISIKTCGLILVIIVTVYILTLGIQNNDLQPQIILQQLHTRENITNISSALQVERFNVDKYNDQGFLLSVYYQQQTTAAFIAYTQLAKIAGLLNLSSVEPYVHDSGIEGGTSYRNRHALKMSSLYNLTDMNSAIKTCCANTDLKSFEEFLNNASPHVVLVSFLTSIKQHQHSLLHGRNIVEFDCSLNDVYVYVHPVLQRLNNWAFSHNTSEMFSCSKVVFLDARPKHELPLRDIIDVLGSIVREQVAMFGSATVVLNTWRGLHRTPDSTFFSYVPGFTTKGCSATRTIKHSDLVISAAHRFVERFNLTQPAVGVHIRGERLLRDSNWNIEYSIDCLQQLYNLLHNHSVDNYFPEKVYVFHDLGEYGSISCSYNKFCIDGQRKLLSKFKQFKFPVIYFDPSTFQSFPKNRAFASFVEREYLSHVRVLVTVGRGGFQQSIVNRVLKYSRGTDKHLHMICNPISPP